MRRMRSSRLCHPQPFIAGLLARMPPHLRSSACRKLPPTTTESSSVTTACGQAAGMSSVPPGPSSASSAPSAACPKKLRACAQSHSHRSLPVVPSQCPALGMSRTCLQRRRQVHTNNRTALPACLHAMPAPCRLFLAYTRVLLAQTAKGMSWRLSSRNMRACLLEEDQASKAARLGGVGGTSRKVLRPLTTWYHTLLPPKSMWKSV